MTKRMREGLGVLCIAGACLVIGIALGQNDDGAADGIGRVLIIGAVLFGVGGLAMLAVELIRKPTD